LPDAGNDKPSRKDNVLESGSPPLEEGIAQARLIFDKYSAKDRQDLLKMLGGLYNFDVTPKWALRAPQVVAPKIVTGGRSTQRAPPRPKAVDPQLSAMRKQIADLNLQISSKSKRLGKVLDEDDELIAKRNQYFRQLRAYKAKSNDEKASDHPETGKE
jgi:hypothetical protein